MRVGIVCPYAWDVPGGVQNHVRDLAVYLRAAGHHVSVLAPADDDTPLPPYVVSAGRAMPVPYNGSIARLNFGFISAARARRWLQEGAFDVLHVHEPATPSLAVLALWSATGPVVATFHTSNPRSRAMSAAYPILQPILEKLSARIAVSEYARRTLVAHLGGDAVVIPNGVDVDFFARAARDPAWTTPAGENGTTDTDDDEHTREDHTGEAGGTLGFVGRIDEPRKGLPTLLAAMPAILARRPRARLLVLGGGDIAEAEASLPPEVSEHVTFLGRLDDDAKARLLRSVDVYVAPNLGGESFGVILVEAMSAGTPVLAADLDAFRQVLGGGSAGELVPVGDVDALAAAAVGLLADPERRARLSAAGSALVRRYDWSIVGREIMSVYEMVTEGAGAVVPDAWPSRLGRLGLGRLSGADDVGWSGAPETSGGVSGGATAAFGAHREGEHAHPRRHGVRASRRRREQR
jgi:phosphatidylinositol alpha-mannosyltransferase